MTNAFSRTQLVLGPRAMQALAGSRVAVFGIGGVGGYVVEALARSGIGALDLVDNDTVSLTNLNRQIIALHSTIGQYKVDVAKARVLDIHPACRVTVSRTFTCRNPRISSTLPSMTMWLTASIPLPPRFT